MQHGCLFSQQMMIATPSLLAAAQQGLQALKMDEKSAMLRRYHRRCERANF
jgi:hypothetical protein